MNEDLICLSSDDEYEPTPKISKAEPIADIRNNGNGMDEMKSKMPKTDSVICIDSDEENDSQDVIIVNKENSEVSYTIEASNHEDTVVDKHEDTAVDKHEDTAVDDLNRIEVISCDSPIPNLSNASSSSSKDGEESEISDIDTSTTEYFEEEVLPSTKEQNGEVGHLGEQSRTSMYKDIDLMADTEDLPKEAISFLSTCARILREGSAEPIFKKFPIIIKMFRSLSQEFAKTEYLSKFLRKQTKIARESVSCCIISFRDVYLHLKDSLNSQSIELPKKHWKHVRKLEKVMEQLLAKLKELEEAEVNFDDENEDDSAYIKHDKYSQRLTKVYKKYCEIMKKNPYAGRITHERLDFVSSNYNEINQAISKKYKNNKKFPSFDELASYIQAVVEEKKLSLSSTELKLESELCFKKLGDLLQIRRKKELYEAHQSYMINEDPAKNDEELEKTLRISSKEGKVRIEQICQEYVKKQELGLTGEEIDLSESDKSEESDEDL